MRRALEQRLERLAAWFNHEKEHAEREDEAFALRRTIAAMVRDGLSRAGIDPDTVPVLRRVEASPASPPVRARRPPSELRLLYERLRRYRDGPPPDPAKASLMQLFAAYCMTG